MNAKSLNAKGIFALLKETYTEWSKDNCMRLGAALAYYSVFSAAPLILIAIGIVGAIYGPQAAQGKVAEQLSSVVGPQVADAVQQLVASAGKTSKGSTITGAIFLLLGASGVFGQLKESLNTIWEVKPKPNQGVWGFIRSRLFTFGMVLVIGFLMLVSLIATTALAAMNQYIEHAFGIPPFVSGLLGFVVPLAVEVLLFALIFKMLPDAKVLWSNVWIGAAVTALLFEIGKNLLSWYLGHSTTTSSFGAAAAPALLLLWVYYTSLILFFGAEFTEVYARATGHVIEPKENAVSVTPEERVQQGMEPDIVPHPSAAAAMAGRDPYTGKAAGGDRSGGRAEPSVLGEDHKAPSRPPKEDVAPLSGSARVFSSEPAALRESTFEPRQSERDAQVWTARQNPLTEFGVALGVGLVMGMISRMMDARRARDLTPGEHLRVGAKAAALAGAAAVAKFGPKLSQSVRPKVVKRTAEKTAERIREIGQQIPQRMEEAFK